VRFEVPERKLSVSQTPGGGLVVSNDDPALTGQTLVIHGEDEYGERHPVTITVPPPDQP